MITKTKKDAESSASNKHQKQLRVHEERSIIFREVKKTVASILSLGLLLFVAFSFFTWYWHNFLGVSSPFWQTQWENLYYRLGGNEWMIFFLATQVVPGTVFWIFNAILMVADITGKPTFITKYRIQLGKNDPVDTKKLHKACLMAVLNQTLTALLLWMILPILKWRGDLFSLSLPTLYWFVLEMAVYLILQEILFYYTHRLYHRPFWYKLMHKQHHEWTAPIGIVSFHAHPLENGLSFLLPVMSGPVLLGSHIVSIMAWLFMVVLYASVMHCGYNFPVPLLPSAEFHDYHHLKSNECYGIIGLLDYLHGTDKNFRKSKVHENISEKHY